jgi:hypothetical protein
MHTSGRLAHIDQRYKWVIVNATASLLFPTIKPSKLWWSAKAGKRHGQNFKKPLIWFALISTKPLILQH